MRNNANFKRLFYALQLSIDDAHEIFGGAASKSLIRGFLRSEQSIRQREGGRENRFRPMNDDLFDLFCANLQTWLENQESDQ